MPIINRDEFIEAAQKTIEDGIKNLLQERFDLVTGNVQVVHETTIGGEIEVFIIVSMTVKEQSK